MIVYTATAKQICAGRFMMERRTLKDSGENSDPARHHHRRNTSENSVYCGGPTCST
jgi:hypothetical protein